MNLATERKPTTLLFNPFVYVAGGKALGIGIAAIVATALLGAVSNTHFDGVLDTHNGMSAPWWIFVGEGLIDWLSLAAVLWILGKMISKTFFRTVDVFGTQAMARWPAFLMTVFALAPGFSRFAQYLASLLLKPGSRAVFNPADAAVFGCVTAIMLVLLIWMVFLMYKAFSVSCNVKGGKAIGAFIGGILAGEVVSKVGMMLLFKLM